MLRESFAGVLCRRRVIADRVCYCNNRSHGVHDLLRERTLSAINAYFSNG